MSKSQSEFAKQAASAKYAKAWKTARKLQPGQSLSTPTLPDGQYIAQVTSSKTGVTKKKELFWTVNCTIIKGPHKSVAVPFYFSLEPVTQGKAEITKLGFATIAAKSLGYEFEDDDASPADFEGIAEELSKDKPTIVISCKNKTIEVTDPKTKRKSEKDVCNWRIERLGQDVSNDPDDDEEVVDDDGDEEDAEDKIEVGDTVSAKLNGARRAAEYEVISINARKKTAKVKDSEDNEHNAKLADLELVYE